MSALVLASASARRGELLARLGIGFEVVPANLDERVAPGEAPVAYAERMARAKAAAVAPSRPDAWVVGADTVVALQDAILGKPENAAQARAMLEALAGRTHHVITGYCLRRGASEHVRVVTTEVDVAPLDAREIEAYVGSGEWRDKAGGYAIQGVFGYAVRAVRGSYTNVVGLPLAEVVADLRRLGALPGFPYELGR